MQLWPLGVFTSIDAGYGVKLEVARELGVPTLQLHAPRILEQFGTERSRDTDALDKVEFWMELEEQTDRFLARLRQASIAISAVFGGFAGESYADIPTVARTVGLVPSETRPSRVVQMKNIADYSKRLSCDVVALHLGFVPHDPTAQLYDDLLIATRDLCDYCKSNGQSLHLETGQEPAGVLLRFIEDVERDNLFINFDPANMILYGVGNPIEALEQLGAYVRSVHCKDAKWAVRPGAEWGQEVPLGEGDVSMESFLRMLKKIGYAGPLTIERELSQEPTRQRAEIEHAVRLLENLKTKILAET